MSSPYLIDFSAGRGSQPRSAPEAQAGTQPGSSHPSGVSVEQLQRVGLGQADADRQARERTQALQQRSASEPMRYLGHWPELLADLALLGPIWVETAERGLRIVQRQRLDGLRVQGMLGFADTAGYQVRILLDHCHALTSDDDERGLAIEGADRQPLAALRLDAGTHPLPLRLLLSGLGVTGRRLLPMPPEQEDAPIASLEQHAIYRLQRDCQALDPAPGSRGFGLRDLAELSGCMRLNPAPWMLAAADGNAGAVAIDPSLVACALETLVDQEHPLALSCGSRGWVSRSVLQFYGHAYVDGQLSLRGQAARLELDVRAIDSAWVVGRGNADLDQRALRLYDDEGRAMAIIASAADPEQATDSSPSRARSRLWTTLMNALIS